MIETPFTRMAEKVIDKKLKVAQKFYDEKIAPLTDFGNPEKLLGKKYEEWDTMDFKKAKAIYGNDEEIRTWLLKKERDRVRKLETEVSMLEGV